MEYYREGIYHEIGRYYATAIIQLKPDSEEYKDHGAELVGTFQYSNKETVEIKKVISESKGESRTHGKIRFKYNNEDGISDENKRKLRQFGISTESIARLQYMAPPFAKDAYAEDGIKKIPDQIIVPFRPGPPTEMVNMQVGLYKSQRERGWRFINEEIAEYIGLEKLYKNNISEELIEEYGLADNESILNRIDYYRLRGIYRLNKDLLTPEELRRLSTLNKLEWQQVLGHFKTEIAEIHEDPEEFLRRYTGIKREAMWQSLKFTAFRLVQRDPAIWWDGQSYAHIMFSHGLEFDNEVDQRPKTRFQYMLKEAIDIIEIVCDIIYDEYVAYEGEVFYREGVRAIEYNGNHYCLRIDSTGKLLQFFPYQKED